MATVGMIPLSLSRERRACPSPGKWAIRTSSPRSSSSNQIPHVLRSMREVAAAKVPSRIRPRSRVRASFAPTSARNNSPCTSRRRSSVSSWAYSAKPRSPASSPIRERSSRVWARAVGMHTASTPNVRSPWATRWTTVAWSGGVPCSGHALQAASCGPTTTGVGEFRAAWAHGGRAPVPRWARSLARCSSFPHPVAQVACPASTSAIQTVI